MITITIRDGKQYARVADLHNWEKNPKDVSTEDFKRLEEQKKLGQFKPLLVMQDGTVLGGNSRLKLYQRDGDEEAWVSPIAFVEGTGEAEGKVRAVINGKVNEQRVFEDQEQAQLEYALADNDQSGRYNSERLAELTIPYQHVMPMSNYKVDLAYPVKLQSILDSLQQTAGDVNGRVQDIDSTDAKLDTYLHGAIRQIVLYFTIEEYTDAVARLEKVMSERKLQNNTEVFLHLLTFYEQHKDLEEPVISDVSEELEDNENYTSTEN